MYVYPAALLTLLLALFVSFSLSHCCKLKTKHKYIYAYMHNVCACNAIATDFCIEFINTCNI